jgi:hypothetical protein
VPVIFVTAAFLIAYSGTCLAQMTALERVLADKIKCEE